MLVLEIVAALLVVAALAPESPQGKVLIRTPARFLAGLTPWGVLMALLPALVVIGLFVSGLELVALLGVADFSLLVMVGVPALVLGVRAQVALLKQRVTSATTRVAAVVRAIVRPLGHSRERTRPRRTRPPPAKADDVDGPAWAWA